MTKAHRHLDPPKLRWRAQRITVDCTNGPRTVTAQVCRGLAVHARQLEVGSDGWWSVTHVPSGLGISSHHALSLVTAYRLARHLLQLTNWERPSDAIIADGLGDKVRQIMEAL